MLRCISHRLARKAQPARRPAAFPPPCLLQSAPALILLPPQAHLHPLYVNEAAEAAGGNGGVAGATAEVLLERALFGGEGGLAGVLGGAHAAKEAAVSGAVTGMWGSCWPRHAVQVPP